MHHRGPRAPQRVIDHTRRLHTRFPGHLQTPHDRNLGSMILQMAREKLARHPYSAQRETDDSSAASAEMRPSCPNQDPVDDASIDLQLIQ